MHLRSLLISTAALALFGVSASSHAAAPTPKGCYKVIRGYESELASGHDQLIGTYSLALAPSEASNSGSPSLLLIGPVFNEGDEGTDAPHTHHRSMGTFNGTGTLTTAKDATVFTSASCPNAQGVPQYVKGTQTLNFVSGTGAYAGLVSGQIEISGTFDACTRPTNPVLTGSATKGVLCFK
jgi:hypothetical protein